MVTVDERLPDVVRQWIGRLELSRVDVRQRFDELGFNVFIAPRNPNGCSVAIEGNQNNIASLVCGRTIRVSDWAVEPKMLIAVLDAIRAGHVEEDIWEVFGHTMRASGVIRLEDGTVFGDRSVGLPLGSHRLLTYEPW